MKIEKMTVPPFLQLEIKLSDSILKNQRRLSKEHREEMRRENRNLLIKKIETLIQKQEEKHNKPNPKTVEKSDLDEVIIWFFLI